MEAVGVTYYTKQAPHKCFRHKSMCCGHKKMSVFNIQKKYKKIYIKAAQKSKVHIFNMSEIGMQGLNKKE